MSREDETPEVPKRTPPPLPRPPSGLTSARHGAGRPCPSPACYKRPAASENGNVPQTPRGWLFLFLQSLAPALAGIPSFALRKWLFSAAAIADMMLPLERAGTADPRKIQMGKLR